MSGRWKKYEKITVDARGWFFNKTTNQKEFVYFV
jgi:hypothetical protein